MLSEEKKKKLLTELKFSAARSSGPGGQHVNKVSTRIELRFNVDSSEVLTTSEKIIIKQKLGNRIISGGELVLVSQVERSQWRNKENAISRFFSLIEKALTPSKRRIKTRPTAASKHKRLESKKLLSQKKQLRKSPDL